MKVRLTDQTRLRTPKQPESFLVPVKINYSFKWISLKSDLHAFLGVVKASLAIIVGIKLENANSVLSL